MTLNASYKCKFSVITEHRNLLQLYVYDKVKDNNRQLSLSIQMSVE